jgi:hypothetical protein
MASKLFVIQGWCYIGANGKVRCVETGEVFEMTAAEYDAFERHCQNEDEGMAKEILQAVHNARRAA